MSASRRGRGPRVHVSFLRLSLQVEERVEAGRQMLLDLIDGAFDDVQRNAGGAALGGHHFAAADLRHGAGLEQAQAVHQQSLASLSLDQSELSHLSSTIAPTPAAGRHREPPRAKSVDDWM